MKNFKELIKSGNAEEIAGLVKHFGLKIEGNKIVAVDKDKTKEDAAYWGQQQQIRKIFLNSLYGSLLQKGSKFYDKRMGQSVTLTGRCITRHMTAKINELVTGKYDYRGEVIIAGDTDSVTGDTLIETEDGKITIQEFYQSLPGVEFSEVSGFNDEKKVPLVEYEVLSYDEKNKQEIFRPLKRIHRHRVNKSKWKLVTESGKEIIVTGDHSLIVERSGKLIEIKPSDINKETDLIISTK